MIQIERAAIPNENSFTRFTLRSCAAGALAVLFCAVALGSASAAESESAAMADAAPTSTEPSTPAAEATSDAAVDPGDGSVPAPAPEASAMGSDPSAPTSGTSLPESEPTTSGGPYEPWHYNTDYFFGLTRGLWEEEGVSPVLRPVVMIFTLPLDIVILPAAALAGLFG